MATYRKTTILILMWLCLFPLISVAQEKIVLGTGLKPPLVSSDDKRGFLDVLVTDAFKRAGLEVQILILPAERVLINANKGIEDGCLLRIKGLEAYYPNLVRVPEMLMVSNFVAYSNIKIDDSLTLEKYSSLYLSYITGWKIFEKIFSQHPNVTKVRQADQMFHLLKVKRVDTVLYEQWQGLAMLKEMKIQGIHLVQPPLVSMEMYMYLHKKNRHLLEKVTKSLSKMKADGTYQSYYQQYLEALNNDK